MCALSRATFSAGLAVQLYNKERAAGTAELNRGHAWPSAQPAGRPVLLRSTSSVDDLARLSWREHHQGF